MSEFIRAFFFNNSFVPLSSPAFAIPVAEGFFVGLCNGGTLGGIYWSPSVLPLLDQILPLATRSPRRTTVAERKMSGKMSFSEMLSFVSKNPRLICLR